MTKNLTDILRPPTRTLSRVALAAGLTAALGLAAPGTSFAQADAPRVSDDAHRGPHARRGRRGPPGRRGHLRRMLAQLDLSEDQRAQIREIVREARADRRARRRQARERIEAVLTPEQREQARALRARHRRARLERRLARMSERLDLSERQQQQVRGILRHAAMQRRALREQAPDDPASARDALRGLRERTRASVRSVLTAEQQAQLEELRERRRERRGRHGRGRGRAR
jgi:Spy/CpxP family protein refolding chaperone